LRRPHVAVIHPQLAYGGSETGALWTIEALKRDCEVTLITGGRADLKRLNAYYATDLRPGEFAINEVRMPLGLHRTAKFAGLRGALFTRECRRLAPYFDVITTHYNPCDLGVPLIQFTADFTFAPGLQRTLDPNITSDRRWWYGDTVLRKAYLGVCSCVARPRAENWSKNVTVANSRWTASVLEREFGIVAQRVQFPPVPGEFPAVPWNEREDGFVCIGRVVPEKRMDAVIRILERLRRQGHNVHLHILGGLEDSPFGRKIEQLAGRHREWVFLEGRTVGDKKREIIATHRYGINARDNEPFGIAPAETVKGGCITFVANGGGQTEIVDHPVLTFADEDDAARKIETVISSVSLEENLRRHLEARAQELSTENFMRTVRDLVSGFLRQKEYPIEINPERPVVTSAI
jgi:glycosyltransferase involved in cell wall biosynthesis